MINVRDFGAVGDSTTDNTTALNNAIAHANSVVGYRVLWFPGSLDWYSITGTLTMLRPNISVWMDGRGIIWRGIQTSGVIWQIGWETASSQGVRHRLGAHNANTPGGGAAYPTGQCMFYVPNLFMSEIEVFYGQRFYTPIRIHATGGGSLVCWGNRIKIGDLRQNVICVDIGGRLGSWFNSNLITGPGVVEGNAWADPLMPDTYGIYLHNDGTGVSGNDNVLDGDLTFQRLDFGIHTDQPNFISVESGRFEGIVTAYSYAGSGDGLNALAMFRPSHTTDVSTIIQRRGGPNKYLSLPIDRTDQDLIWGTHRMRGYRRAFFTMPTASGAPDWDHAGAYITTDASLTIPAQAGWECTLEVAATTHNLVFDGRTLNVSSAGIEAGDVLWVLVKSLTEIRVMGRAGTFTEADFEVFP